MGRPHLLHAGLAGLLCLVAACSDDTSGGGDAAADGPAPELGGPDAARADAASADAGAPGQDTGAPEAAAWPDRGPPDRVLYAADLTTPDAQGGDLGSTVCAAGATVRLQEVGVGTDFVVLKNTGSAQADLEGYRLVTYTLPHGTTLAAAATLYLFEYNYGVGANVINTGANIPFYDGINANAVALYDDQGALVDYLAMGDKVVGLPPGVSATLLSWPGGFSAASDRLQRVAAKGACPTFTASDWTSAKATQPTP